VTYQHGISKKCLDKEKNSVQSKTQQQSSVRIWDYCWWSGSCVPSELVSSEKSVQNKNIEDADE